MKSITTLILLLNISLVNAQVHSLEFSECYVNSRISIDSNFNSNGYFFGDGYISLDPDTSIITFSNEWECGTYKLFVDGIDQFRDKKELITHYWGRVEYFGWSFDLYLIRDENLQPISVLFDTEYTTINDKHFARKRRIYPIHIEDNKLTDEY